MTVKEVYAILKELEDHIEGECCTVTMDADDVKDLITKLRKAIHAYSKKNNNERIKYDNNYNDNRRCPGLCSWAVCEISNHGTHQYPYR